jgi:hypothetical protein
VDVLYLIRYVDGHLHLHALGDKVCANSFPVFLYCDVIGYQPRFKDLLAADGLNIGLNDFVQLLIGDGDASSSSRLLKEHYFNHAVEDLFWRRSISSAGQLTLKFGQKNRFPIHNRR